MIKLFDQSHKMFTWTYVFFIFGLVFFTSRIPLVPRRPRSTEGFFPIQTPAGTKPEKGSKSRAGKKDKQKEVVVTASVEETHESPLPPCDPDEKVN